MPQHPAHRTEAKAYTERMRDVPLGGGAVRCPKCGHMVHGLNPVDAEDFHAGNATPARYICGDCIR